jgi:hypothetical protein
MHDLWNSLLGHIRYKICLGRCLVDIIYSMISKNERATSKLLTDASEVRNLSVPSTRIRATSVRRFAILQRSSNMNKEEVSSSTTGREDRISRSLSRSFIRRDRGCNDSRSCPSELSAHECDALDVGVSVFRGEGEFG